MKKSASKFLGKCVLFLLCLTMVSSCLPATQVEAASAKKKAMKAYGTYLKKHKSKTFSRYYDASFSSSDKSYVNYFFLYDIDGNGVPELFTETDVNYRWFIIRIYTYKNGKMTKYKFKDGSAAEFNDNASANGSYSFYICSKGHIHNSYSGGMVSSEQVYKKCGSSGKKIKELKNYTGSCKKISLKTYKNNASNRKKLTRGTAKVNK